MKIFLLACICLLNAPDSPPTREVIVNGLAGPRCTIILRQGATALDAMVLIASKIEIAPMQSMDVVDGAKKLKLDEVLRDDLRELTLLVTDRPPHFCSIESRSMFAKIYRVKILDPALAFLDPGPMGYILRYSRAAGLSGMICPIEHYPQDFFRRLECGCPCRPSSWDKHEGCIPYCDLPSLLRLRESGASRIFSFIETMTVTEHKLFAIFITNIGGYLRYDDSSRILCSDVLGGYQMPSTKILDLTEPQEEVKIDRDHPKMKEMVERFVNGTGEFARGADGSIENARSEIVDFVKCSPFT